jgi:hypothetical protein
MSRRPSPDFFEDELTHLVQTELENAWRDIPPRDPTMVERQRATFIAAGVRLGQQAKWMQVKFLSKTALRYAAIVIFTLLSTFVGARVVSAQSLPGDRLYPVKLSLESVDGLFYGGERWHDQQEARRLDEVLTIAAQGESAVVNFVASPFLTDDGQWYVGAVPLMVTAEQNRMLHNQCAERDTSIRIFAQVIDGKIYARAITPSCFFVASR